MRSWGCIEVIMLFMKQNYDKNENPNLKNLSSGSYINESDYSSVSISMRSASAANMITICITSV